MGASRSRVTATNTTGDANGRGRRDVRTKIRKVTRRTYCVIVLIPGRGLEQSDYAATFDEAYENLRSALGRSGILEFEVHRTSFVGTHNATIVNGDEHVSLFETWQSAVRWEFTVDFYGDPVLEDGPSGGWLPLPVTVVS